MSSKMPQVYIHYYGNESVNSLLEIKGIIKNNDMEKSNIIKSKQCPNCNEPNKPDSKFCIKCRLVLNYNSYNQVLEQQKEKESEIKSMKEQINRIENQLNGLFSCMLNLDQKQVNQTAKLLYRSGILNKQQNYT